MKNDFNTFFFINYLELFTVLFTYIFLECLVHGITSIIFSPFFLCLLHIYQLVSRTSLTVVYGHACRNQCMINFLQDELSSVTLFFYCIITDVIMCHVPPSKTDVNVKNGPACLAHIFNFLLILGSKLTHRCLSREEWKVLSKASI